MILEFASIQEELGENRDRWERENLRGESRTDRLMDELFFSRLVNQNRRFLFFWRHISIRNTNTGVLDLCMKREDSRIRRIRSRPILCKKKKFHLLEAGLRETTESRVERVTTPNVSHAAEPQTLGCPHGLLGVVWKKADRQLRRRLKVLLERSLYSTTAAAAVP